jgi:hypothetical protein
MRPRRIRLASSPMQDQVIGGILMWVADSFYLMLITTLIFFRWARDEEIEVPPVNLRRQPELRVLRPTRTARDLSTPLADSLQDDPEAGIR